jgi:hypothetical protein
LVPNNESDAKKSRKTLQNRLSGEHTDYTKSTNHTS